MNNKIIPEATGIYIRVSTDDQVREGFSINAQRDKLTKYAELNDWLIVDYYIDEGISGKNIKDRPEMNRLLSDVKTGKVSNILIYKLDRLTRSLLNLMELIKIFEIYNCSLNSHTEKLDTSNAVGRMFVKILGTFAEFERENLAERISFGYEQKTKEGNYTNTNGVYGYDYIVGEGKLKINEEEASFVNKIYDLYLSNNSMLSICKMLNSENVPTKRGGKWAQSTIKSILTNPLYIGKVRYGVGFKNKHKSITIDSATSLPIMAKEKYESVQRLMGRRKSFKTRRYSSDDSYYFHVLKCGECGGKMQARQQMQAGKKYVSYFCGERYKRKCAAAGFSHQKIETAFINYLKQLQFLIPDDSVFENYEVDEMKSKQKALNEVNRVKAKKEETRNLFLNGSLPFDEYKILIEKLKERLNKLTEQLQNNLSNHNDNYSPLIKKREITGNIKLNWEHLNNRERKTFLERFVKFIEVKTEQKIVKLLKIEFNN